MIILDMPIKRSLLPAQYTQVQPVMQRLGCVMPFFLKKTTETRLFLQDAVVCG
jgi:hypothetical protein